MGSNISVLPEQHRLHRVLDRAGYDKAIDEARAEVKELLFGVQRECAKKILEMLPRVEVRTPFDLERLAKTILQAGQAVAVLGLPNNVRSSTSIQFVINPPDPAEIEKRRKAIELATAKAIDVKAS